MKNVDEGATFTGPYGIDELRAGREITPEINTIVSVLTFPAEKDKAEVIALCVGYKAGLDLPVKINPKDNKGVALFNYPFQARAIELIRQAEWLYER
ncbi:MAG: hypothetical protein EOP45_00020 [Sphingobacteriaceae bacterium]|nr:MAG: hypothetical protein EOP45_00020 [Sphingobacteriaceae bacterium]